MKTFGALIWKLVKWVAGFLLPFLIKRAEQPSTIKDEQTPANIKSGWDNYISNELRDKDGSDKS